MTFDGPRRARALDGGMPGGRSIGSTQEKPKPAPDELAKATRVVAGARATRDPADCRLLLTALGLVDDPDSKPKQPPRDRHKPYRVEAGK